MLLNHRDLVRGPLFRITPRSVASCQAPRAPSRGAGRQIPDGSSSQRISGRVERNAIQARLAAVTRWIERNGIEAKNSHRPEASALGLEKSRQCPPLNHWAVRLPLVADKGGRTVGQTSRLLGADFTAMKRRGQNVKAAPEAARSHPPRRVKSRLGLVGGASVWPASKAAFASTSVIARIVLEPVTAPVPVTASE